MVCAQWCNFNCGEPNVSTRFVDVPGQQTIGESLLSIDRWGPFNSSTAANLKVTPSTDYCRACAVTIQDPATGRYFGKVCVSLTLKLRPNKITLEDFERDDAGDNYDDHHDAKQDLSYSNPGKHVEINISGSTRTSCAWNRRWIG